MSGRDLVIGVGSPHGDDAVGWRVVEQLAARVSAQVQTLAVREPTHILSHVAAGDRVWIVDGCRGGGRPGQITRIEWRGGGLPDALHKSTHGYGLEDVLRLLVALGCSAGGVVLYAIEVHRSDPETSLTPEIAGAVPEVAQRILAELNDAMTPNC